MSSSCSPAALARVPSCSSPPSFLCCCSSEATFSFPSLASPLTTSMTSALQSLSSPLSASLCSTNAPLESFFATVFFTSFSFILSFLPFAFPLLKSPRTLFSFGLASSLLPFPSLPALPAPRTRNGWSQACRRRSNMTRIIAYLLDAVPAATNPRNCACARCRTAS